MKYVEAAIEAVGACANLLSIAGATFFVWLCYTGHVVIMQSPHAFMIMVK